MKPYALFAFLCCASCGSSKSGGSVDGGLDAGPPDLSSVDLVPAVIDMAPPSRPLMHPMMMTNHNGPILAAPEPWVFVWQGDQANGQFINGFYSDLFANHSYWGDILSQYGVGPGSAKGVQMIPNAAPASLTIGALFTLIDQLGTQVTKNANTVVALLIPPTTTLVGAPSDAGGWHSMSPGGLPFLVVLESTQTLQGYRSPLDALTVGASHELAETATDPNPISPAWFDDELQDFGEVGDLCNPLWNLMLAGPSGGAAPNGQYGTAKLYSNAAAMQGSAITCLPNFVQSQPPLNVEAAPHVLTVGAGQSVSLVLDFASVGDPGAIDWTVGAEWPTGVTALPTMGTSALTDTPLVTISVPPSAQFADFPVAIFAQSESYQYSHGVFWLLVHLQ
jgi:hypothetical protein